MNKNVKKGTNNIVDFYKNYRGTPSLVFEIFAGIIAAIGSLYIFLKISNKIVAKEIIFFDQIIIDFIHAFESPLLTKIMKFVTFFGGEIFIGGAVIITISVLILTRHRKDAFLFGFILVFGIILNLWLKGFFERARPDLFAMLIEKTYSFPSGHSMNSFVFFMSISYFIFHNNRNKKLSITLTLISGLIVFLIGISRIYLGVHYPSDVLGGYAAGLLWFVGVLLFEKILIFLRLFKKYELENKY
ncbi:MAG TPA: phosphatase PAP2 family protein [Candidatus Limnocylindrales bacterium]|nr:phosphatase PAP2 family protein [Candidatus Limnocylindrales bacterium]